MLYVYLYINNKLAVINGDFNGSLMGFNGE